MDTQPAPESAREEVREEITQDIIYRYLSRIDQHTAADGLIVGRISKLEGILNKIMVDFQTFAKDLSDGLGLIVKNTTDGFNALTKEVAALKTANPAVDFTDLDNQLAAAVKATAPLEELAQTVLTASTTVPPATTTEPPATTTQAVPAGSV